MDRFNPETDIARRVTLAISEASLDVHSVAQAADITTSDMEDRLNGRVPFMLSELVDVGGFLRIPVSRFMKEAA